MDIDVILERKSRVLKEKAIAKVCGRLSDCCAHRQVISARRNGLICIFWRFYWDVFRSPLSVSCPFYSAVPSAVVVLR